MNRPRNLAITVEGFVVSAPTIQPNNPTFSSFDGVAVISGNLAQKAERGGSPGGGAGGGGPGRQRSVTTANGRRCCQSRVVTDR